MKKCSAIIGLVLAVSGVFSVTSCAQSNRDIVVNLQINNPTMVVNGENTAIDDDETMPLIRDGRTLVPIRAIIESFGGEVAWNGSTQTVSLALDDDVITLGIDSNEAYLNNTKYTIDVPPTIINEHTMLPIRFIAEGFNLGVAWDDDTKTVSIIRNELDDDEYEYIINEVPEYSGKPYAKINDNIPMFEDYEIINGSFEYYSDLDDMGRCDVCMASIAEDIMPTEKRGDISSVKPTGWINVAYDGVDGGYLYNRCHLIGYQLTGENANERNLITGTRYFNTEGMLPFENMVDDYIEETGNRVMYRVTPVFKDDNLVADGVLMEAYSVEDKGRGVSFCVYCYNVQPDITIDYKTGASYIGNASAAENVKNRVYRTPTGKRYHFDKDCGGKNSYEITLTEATASGLTPCGKCAK